jgi:hypothetical protein
MSEKPIDTPDSPTFEAVDPDELVASLTQRSIWGSAFTSIAAHVVLIAATSVTFVMFCWEKQSLDPHAVERVEIAANEEQEREEARRKAVEAASKSTSSEADGNPDASGESSYQKKINETSPDRPDSSDLELDGLFDE